MNPTICPENTAPVQHATGLQTSGRPAGCRVHFSGWASNNGNNDDQPIVVKQLGPLLKPASEMKRKEKIELWYRDADVRAFRKEAIRLAGSIKESCEQSNEIDGIDTMNYSNVHKMIYEAAKSGENPSLQTIKYLGIWHTVSASVRGLERWSLPPIALDRMSRIDATIKKVLSLQETIDGNIFDAEEKAQLIRCASEQMTRPSKCLAQIFAGADEVAAKMDNNQMKILRNTMKSSFSEVLLLKKSSSASSKSRRNPMPMTRSTSAFI
jgi:hypothetical protein